MNNIDELKFHKQFNTYVKYTSLAIKISKSIAGRLVDYRKGWASILFTKICVTSISLKKLADLDTGKKYNSHWDFNSAFTLARNLMECYQTFFYLCIDKISEDEALARKKLFNYHDFMAREKLFKEIGKEEPDIDLKDQLIKELTSTKYFQNLEEKQQRHFLKGTTAFFVSREEIEHKIGNSKSAFKVNYQLLSTYTHSFPMGFYKMFEPDRGTGVKTPIEEICSAYALGLAEEYLKLAINNMLEIFPDLYDKLNKQDKDLLEIKNPL